jgi:ketosteroid isomerase-like protein
VRNFTAQADPGARINLQDVKSFFPMWRLSMKLNLCALLLLFPLLGFQQAPPKTSTHEEAVIREVLEQERHTKDAMVHSDATFTERSLADDYVAIGPLGDVITKAEVIASRRTSQTHYESVNFSEVAVRVYGEMAIVTARAEVKGTDLGQDFSGPYRFTRVWVKHNGEWKTVSYQATATQ